VGSLLLEYLVSVAARLGARRLVADVLAMNHHVFRVIADSGVPVIASRTVMSSTSCWTPRRSRRRLTPMSGTSTPSWSARPDPTLRAFARPCTPVSRRDRGRP
jgi:hypothetical protein